MSYSLNSSVLSKTGLAAAQLQSATNAVRHNSFNNFQAFVDAENNYGISSVYLLAHACVESAWATELIAPNNLYGFNADDANPSGDASSFTSQAACIDFVAKFLKQFYLTPGGRYYVGPTLHDVFVHYSSSHDAEANTVAEVMNMITAKIPIPQQPTPTPVPTPTPANTYSIKSGDTFWGLEAAHDWPHGTLQSLNPGVVPTRLQIGQVIHVPGAPAKPQTTKYRIKSGDTFWALETSFGLAHGTLQALNPGVNPRLLQVGQEINV